MLEITLVDDDGYAGRLHIDPAKLGRFTRLRPTVVSICQRFRPQRQRVERFLEGAYAQAFGGIIREHYPILMSVWDAEGELHAAAGFRFAAVQPLFLEQYLDQPIEAAVSEAAGEAVPRHRIAEIGNLASESAGASMFLFLALAGYLEQHRCSHAAATATRPLARMFRQVGFSTHRLAAACPERLRSNPADWGDYYDHDPVVLVGEIRPALAPLQQRLASEPPNLEEPVARIHLPLGSRL